MGDSIRFRAACYLDDLRDLLYLLRCHGRRSEGVCRAERLSASIGHGKRSHCSGLRSALPQETGTPATDETCKKTAAGTYTPEQRGTYEEQWELTGEMLVAVGSIESP